MEKIWKKMKQFNKENINTPEYWNSNQTATDFGLRQEKYAELVGDREKVIELGCGLSQFLNKIENKERWGLDFSPETIETAKIDYPYINYVVGSATETPFKDKYFDAVVAGEIIEHLEDPELLIKEMERISKDLIVLSTPILEFDDPEHLWEFDEDWFKDRGFTTEVVESERFPGRKYIFAHKRTDK